MTLPRLNRRRPLPYVALLGLSLISIEPLARPLLTCTDDSAVHVFRAVELAQQLKYGYLFPRWSPDMAHGFGYPMFNFYAPLSTYVTVAFHALGLTFPAAMQAAFALGVWLAALCTFWLAREWWGERAGLAAAAVYVSAPYFAFDILFRGALAESFAWWFPPLILWGMDRAAGGGARPGAAFGWTALAAAAYAGLILTHNNLALLASPLFGGYALLLAWERRSLRALARSAAALLLGLALSAFFWAPALLERGLVHSDRLLVPPIFTYHSNFIGLRELFAPPAPADPSLLNPSPPKALGLVTAALASASVVVVLSLRAGREGRARASFFAGGLAAYALMTLPVSKPLWDHLPLLPFVQFPWRMLGPAAMCAAAVVGAGVGRLDRFGNWPLAGVVVAAFVGNLSWWYPRYCAPLEESNLARNVEYEYGSYTVGTSAKAEFLPRTVDAIPDDDSLAQAIAAGREPERLDTATLPAGASVEYLDRDPLDTRLKISAPVEFQATYKMFFYPGWSVRIDDQFTPVQPMPVHGLISFRVPPGEHTVRVKFGETPLRAAADSISGLSLLLVVAVLVAVRPSLFAIRNSQFPIRNSQFLAALLPFALLALKIAVIDRTENPLRRSAFGTEMGAGIGAVGAGFIPALLPAPTAPTRLAGGLDVLAYDVQPAIVASGGAFDALLYLAPREPPAGNYRPKFTVVSDDGRIWNVAPDEALPPRWHREPPQTQLWPLGQYAQWARRATLLAGTPPGRYRLVAAVFDLGTLAPLSIIGEDGNPRAPQMELGQITVTRPARPADPAALPVQHTSRQALGEGLTLLGYNLDREEARPGDAVLVTLFWHAEAAPGRDLSVTLELLDSAGEVAHPARLSPAADWFPTSLWQAGDVWAGQHLIRLPAALDSGRYSWRLSLTGVGRPVALGGLSLSAPERTFTPPAFEQPSGAVFGQIIELAGYSISGPEAGEAPTAPAMSVTLVWRSLAAADRSYVAFVHLTDAAGRVWAQSDAVPADWARPTTGWLPGEYIADARRLSLPADLPPGEYALSVGLYDAEAGERLPVSGPGAQADGRVSLISISLP